MTDARELRSLGHDLTKAGLAASTKAVQAINKTAADITADAKSGAPVDTGNLKNSIGYDVSSSAGEVTAEIGPTAEYGHYVEFGTSRMAPQPYLTPAFDRRLPGFEKAMGQLVEGVL